MMLLVSAAAAIHLRSGYYDADPNLYGAPKDPMEDYRLERLNGTLTKLSGFNHADDSSVTKLNVAGNAVLEEEFLDDLFDRYYTHKKTKKGEEEGPLILAKDWAYKAGREIVQTWKKGSDEETEQFLTAHFEPAWEHIDVNYDGFIDP